MNKNLFIRWLKNVYTYHIKKTAVNTPFVYSLFATYRCNFKCEYCDNGSEKKYPELEREEIGTEDYKKVIDRVKKETNFIAFGGGEPLMRKDLEELLDYSHDIGFKRIAINTNALGILKRPGVMRNVNHLMVSLDSMNTEYLDKIYGIPSGTTNKIIRNIDVLSRMQKEHSFKLIINSVIMNENLLDLYDVMKYCIENDIMFSPSPLLVGPYPEEKLVNSDIYKHFIDVVLDMKRHGMLILETFAYLNTVRHIEHFKCLPMLYMRISPKGELIFPCMMLSKLNVNVLDYERLQDAVDYASSQVNVDELNCDNRCHISCYVEPSKLVTHPSTIAVEGGHMLKLKILRLVNKNIKQQLLDRLERHQKKAIEIKSSEIKTKPDLELPLQKASNVY